MQKIPLSLISPSPHPIRKSWDEGKMQELAQSIKEQGIIVPIKVRPTGAGVTIDPATGEVWEGVKVNYEVVYGHRRIEAARRAGLEDIPAIVEGVSDEVAHSQALTENFVRENMTNLETAGAFQKEKDEYGYTNVQVGIKYGLSEAGVRKFLRILRPDIKPIVESYARTITPSHVELAIRAKHDAPKVLEKAGIDSLSYDELAVFLKSYVAADTQGLKQAILEVDAKVAKTPEQITFTARAMGKGEAYSNLQEKKRAQKKRDVMEGFDRAVKTFLDFTKDYDETVKMAQETARVGRFSPEAKRFAVRRLNSLMDNLQVLLDELGD